MNAKILTAFLLAGAGALFVVGTVFLGRSDPADTISDDGASPSADRNRIWVRDTGVTVPGDWYPGPGDAFMVPTSTPVSFTRTSGFAAPVRSVLQNSLVAALALHGLNLEYSLTEFAKTVPRGQKIEVTVVTRGTSVIGVTDNPHGSWMRPGDRQQTYTIYGTNLQMAVDEGYDCHETAAGNLCVPPQTGPHGTDYIQDAIDSGGTVDAWSDAVRRASKDVTDATQRHLQEAQRHADSQRHGDAAALRVASESVARGPDENARPIDTKYHRRVLDAAATVIGVSDRRMGQQVAALGTAALNVHDAVQKFSTDTAAASGWVGGALAAVALGSGLAAVGPLLVTAFLDVDAGPSGDQLILEQLHQLRSQVAELRTEIHDRFDGVHDHLDQVFMTMLDAFDVLRDGDRRALEAVLGRLKDTRRQITEIGLVQLDTQQITAQHYEMLRDLLVNLELSGCDRLHSVADDDPMTISKYRDCRATIATLHRTLLDRQWSPPQAPTTRTHWLTARPDETLSWSLTEFRTLLAATGPEGVMRATALPEQVVGPEAWYALSQVYDDFVRRYPDYAERDAAAMRRSAFVTTMRQWRGGLIRYAEAIREEVRAFQDESRPTVFSILLSQNQARDRFAAVLVREVGDPFALMWQCLAAHVTTRADCETLDMLAAAENVRHRVDGLQDLQRLRLSLATANAHLKAWLSLAFRDLIGRSDSITALASGWVEFDNFGDIDAPGGRLAYPQWPRLLEELDDNIELSAQLLRDDDDVRRVAAQDFQHAILTASFWTLGDDAQ